MNKVLENIARVVSENRGSYEVINKRGRFLAKITGKQMIKASSREDYPVVGDWVEITEIDSRLALINKILPRKTMIRRSRGNNEIQIIGTNIDVAFVVESVNHDYNLNRLERYFTILRDENIKMVVVFNKIDLISKKEIEEIISQTKKRFDIVDIILTNALDEKGTDDLKKYIEKDKTYCFLGSSGVGKSSLINKLIGEENIKTGEINEYNERGRHITVRREMYFLKNGGMVIDNPGIRGVGIANTKVEDSFDQISKIAKKCRYKDCSHINEPGCAVLRALKAGKLDESKYNNYINLKKESEFYEMSEIEKRKKDKDFGKFIKEAKKEIDKYNNY
ncbi:MAG: ribosome small subunit-dependent GTPase A [Candidatus Paceibacterota bacterium]|jgi:ribosome biogenesis GTPase